MAVDVADDILCKVMDFTVGFGWAGDKVAAKGSGVLIKQGNMHGILTCAHVDTYLRSLQHVILPWRQKAIYKQSEVNKCYQLLHDRQSECPAA